MTRVDAVVRMVGYDRTVFGRFERAIRRRGWAAATANRETGHLSLKNTLVHILNVQEAWLVAIAQDRPEVFDRPGRRPDAVRSWREYTRNRQLVERGVDRLLSGLTEAQLDRRVRAAWMPGTYTLEDAFHQASYEQAHHIGEIIAVFWQQDWRPPKMTWIENAPPNARRPAR